MQLSNHDTERINRAKDLIDADMTRHYSIQEIATHALMSATKLKAGFKQLEKAGLYHYLKEQRLNKGKDQVENTDNTLEEISSSMGYRHVCNFITAFKKRYGKSPGLWRRKVSIISMLLLQYLQEFLVEQEFLFF